MDTRIEATGLLREAQEDLNRASRYSELADWVTVTHYAQLTIEKSAKALICCFEAFRWTHDPSAQLSQLVDKGHLPAEFVEIATYARAAAPWHGRSTYGGLRKGVWKSPSELCTEDKAMALLDKARITVQKATSFIAAFFGDGDEA